MENKIELKFLASYLPYGLKQVYCGLLKTHGLDKPFISDIHASNIMTLVDGDTYNRPILRPLSDLTKEIEMNGEKFVPLRKLEELFPCFEIYNDDEISFLYSDTDCRGQVYNSVELLKVNDLQNKLFEWHFDVFNLVEQGLAIDINSL